MCGRFVITSPPAALRQIFGYVEQPNFPPRHNIAPTDFGRWLDCSADEAETVMALLTAPGEGEFVWHEVSTRVNRAANDDAQLSLPITAEERAAEEPKPARKAAARKAAPASEDDGQGSLF